MTPVRNPFNRIQRVIIRFAFLVAWIVVAISTEASVHGEIIATAWRLGTPNDLESLLFRLDVDTGQATLIGTTGFQHVTGLAADPTTGRVYGIQNDRAAFNSRLLAINLNTGAGTSIGETQVAISEAHFDARGNLFGWMNTGGFNRFSQLSDQLVSINTTTADVSLIGESGVNSNRTGLAFHPDGTLYLKSGDLDASNANNDPRGTLYTLDSSSGAATFVTRLSGEPENVLEFGTDGTAYTVDRRSDGSYLQTIDIVSGQLTEVAPIVNSATGLPLQVSSIVSVTAVPEPSTLVVLSTGIAFVFQHRKRRRPTAPPWKNRSKPSLPPG